MKVCIQVSILLLLLVSYCSYSIGGKFILYDVLIQGVDPDAPEDDDEDNEVDDGDGDQEEAELL